MKNKILRLVYSLTVALALAISGLGITVPDSAQAAEDSGTNSCHFGLSSGGGGFNIIDVSTYGIGSYMTWGAEPFSSVPSYISHIKVLRVGDQYVFNRGHNRTEDCSARGTFAQTQTALPGLLSKYPGATWIIGNEPDTTYGCQDAVTADVYAQRYFTLATTIRSLDPSAKLVFGTFVQPSPMRIKYADMAWTALKNLAGGQSQASALVDAWNIHAYILNEELAIGTWGTGVPPGFESNSALYGLAQTATTADTYSVPIFTSRLVNFRQHMKDWGEQNKPLYLTEWGVLLPPLNTYGFQTIPDSTVASFLTQTADFILGASVGGNSGTNTSTGYPSDGNRLVQRAYWFSLQHDRGWYGGSLTIPGTPQRTAVGDTWINYNRPDLSGSPVPDLYIQTSSVHVSPWKYVNPPPSVQYAVTLRVWNRTNSDTQVPAQTTLYEVVGGQRSSAITSAIGNIMRCAGATDFTLQYTGIPDVNPSDSHTFVLETKGQSSYTAENISTMADNTYTFTLKLGEPLLLFLPQVVR